MLDLAIAIGRMRGLRGSFLTNGMITGAHFLLYTSDPAADCAFLKTLLAARSVDGGDGMTIVALPPAELAVHPGDGAFVQPHAGNDLAGIVLYLQCEDIDATIREIGARGAQCAPIQDSEFGLFSAVDLPSGAKVGLYQPSHPTAI